MGKAEFSPRESLNRQSPRSETPESNGDKLPSSSDCSESIARRHECQSIGQNCVESCSRDRFRDANSKIRGEASRDDGTLRRAHGYANTIGDRNPVQAPASPRAQVELRGT